MIQLGDYGTNAEMFLVGLSVIIGVIVFWAIANVVFFLLPGGGRSSGPTGDMTTSPPEPNDDGAGE